MSLIDKKEKIFVAGSGGMVGNAIKSNLINNGYFNLELPTRKELDLSNNSLVFDWFQEKQPKIVIVAAAKVGGIHSNNKYPVNFLLNNLKIQNNIIEAAWKNNARTW